MTVCYLIQSHGELTQLLRLIATLKRLSPSCLVLVAHDSTGTVVDPAIFDPWPGVSFLLVRGPAQRGRLSLLDPYFRGVEHLRSRGQDYHWLIYLSAQDYPVKPLAAIEAFLAASKDDAFLRFWPALTPTGGRVRDRRYRYVYFDGPRWLARLPRVARAFNGAQPLVHVHLAYGPRIGLRRLRPLLPKGWILYRGYQWTTLRRACAEHLLDAMARERATIRYFERTICPDEALVQTLLANAGGFRLVDDDFRYHQTGRTPDGRARILGVSDLPELLSGRCHFARKFDPRVDAEVLDLLDSALTLEASGVAHV